MASEDEQQQPLLLLQQSRIKDLSSETIEELLEYKSVMLRWWPRLFAWESRLLWLLSGPSIVVSLFNYMISFVTLMFSGHFGTVEFAGASISAVGVQGLCYGIMLGMATAVQTLCGQAYGAKKYSLMGVICQRAILLHFVAAFLLSFIYWFSGPIFEAIGQSKEIAEAGQVFCRGLILQLYAFSLSLPMQRFLQAQNIVNPLAYMAVGVFFLHILLSWIVVYVLDYGLLYTALTCSLSWWILLILNWLYIVLSPSCKESWTGLSAAAFKGMWPYFKLTVASTVMLALEIWYSQGLILISGLLPNATVAVDSISICMNYWNWDINFIIGLTFSTGVRVGNELGAGHPRVTKMAVIVASITNIALSIIFCVIVLVFRVGLSKLFTSDSEVIDAVSDLTPLLAVSILINGIQPVLTGVAIGSGWQHIIAYVNIITYYLIGLPIGCLLGFLTSLGVNGIWWGLICGYFAQALVLLFLTVRTDWEEQVVKAAERVRNSASEEVLQNVLGIE